MNYCVVVVEYLRLITLSDLVDIVILSFILYKCINLLQWTNAAKVAKVLLIMVACMWVSYQLSLDAINFLLSKAMELGFLALVILFQPEIRRFFEQVGTSGRISLVRLFRDNGPSSEVERAIQETVEAYQEMSDNKVGALLVFERDVKLDNVISSGTAFQSTVNSELLKNLFYNKAPLHDGAVIVRRGNLVAAGCMLPLSDSMSLSKDLGMRHRAGLGMSERSDAVVAVVSEETGAISVMLRGTLRRHLSAATLNRVLRNELLPRQEEAQGGRVSRALAFWQGRAQRRGK